MNPVLNAFHGFSWSTRWHADYWLMALDQLDTYGGNVEWDEPGHPFHALTTATPEQIDDARRILSDLAVLS